jgi:hypothetical protein
VLQLIIEVPEDLALEVMNRLQERYPAIVAAAVSPADAMHRVVAWWTGSLLADSAAAELRSLAESEIAAIREQVEQDAAAAAAAAWQRVTAALETPLPPPDPPVGP